MKRKTITDIMAMKNKQQVCCLTAYTAPFTKILDGHTDILLVGDTVGMILYGMDSTLPVSVEMMINHGKAVVKSSKESCVIVDMPFASYQESKIQAFANAAKIMQETGCQGIKLEGGEYMAKTVRFLVQRGIPVMGHVGLLPQQVNVYGGFKKQGKDEKQKEQIIKDAIAIYEAGAFAIVAECVTQEVAVEITKKVPVPIIGIGAKCVCDGQVMVTEDIVGLSTNPPAFARQFGNVSAELEQAVAKFSDAVRKKQFP